jgi:hypothetical protein
VLGALLVGGDVFGVADSLRVVYQLSDIRMADGRAFVTVYGRQVVQNSVRFTQFDYTMGRATTGRAWVVLELRTQGS